MSTNAGIEHGERPRTCSGDIPTQRDTSGRYADDPEFLREACRKPREDDDEEA